MSRFRPGHGDALQSRPAGDTADGRKGQCTAGDAVHEFQGRRASNVEQGDEIIRRLESEIRAARFDAPEGDIELLVKLRVYDSIFIPLAKWAMLMAGNYRCITDDGARTAREAVHF